MSSISHWTTVKFVSSVAWDDFHWGILASIAVFPALAWMIHWAFLVVLLSTLLSLGTIAMTNVANRTTAMAMKDYLKVVALLEEREARPYLPTHNPFTKRLDS